jgi:hypothetical protein
MRIKLYKCYMLIAILTIIGSSANGQDYERAFKVKGNGFSFKQLTSFEKGFEITIHTVDEMDSFIFMRIFQRPAFPRISDKWFVCYGYGAHVAFYDSYSISNPFKPLAAPRQYNRSFMSPGFDGLIAFEYRFLKNPFVISVELNPNFEFFGPNYFSVNAYNTMALAFVF